MYSFWNLITFRKNLLFCFSKIESKLRNPIGYYFKNHCFQRAFILPVGEECLPMKYEPITGLYQNFDKFIPNSNRLRGRSANHQGSGPYNQGCVFPFVYKGKEDKDFLRYGRNTKLNLILWNGQNPMCTLGVSGVDRIIVLSKTSHQGLLMGSNILFGYSNTGIFDKL